MKLSSKNYTYQFSTLYIDENWVCKAKVSVLVRNCVLRARQSRGNSIKHQKTLLVRVMKHIFVWYCNSLLCVEIKIVITNNRTIYVCLYYLWFYEDFVYCHLLLFWFCEKKKLDKQWEILLCWCTKRNVYIWVQ